MGEGGYIIIKADSLEEALEKAQVQLNTSKAKIEVKVVNKEKRGFIFRKETVTIQAWIKEKEAALEQLVDDLLSDSAEYLERVENTIDGTIEIINGKVVVKNPQCGGKYPTIEPGENIRVIINGEPISEATIISAEDDVKIEAYKQEPYIDLDVEVDDDKQSAFLVVNRRFGKECQVMDCRPCIHVRVRHEVIKEVPPPKISPREVITLLKDKGIVYGINESSISRVVESNTEGANKVLIAEGQPPEPSKNAAVEYIFQKKEASSNTSFSPYSRNVDLSVEVGEVLAIKSEAREGKAGINIFGETIVPKPPEDTQILTGDGVRLINNETVAVAAIAGRPVLEGRKTKTLKVIPTYTVTGDVDISVGNVIFKGDVIVYGNVLEGFQVVAGGDIIVHGNVIQAELSAGRNITVYKNVISSELNAGENTLICTRLLPYLKQISSLIHNLLKAMQYLKNHNAFKVTDLRQGEGHLVQLLIDTKFKIIPKLILELFEIINTSKFGLLPELQGTVAQLQKLTGINPLRIQKGQEVFDIARVVEANAQKIQENSELDEPANVTADYIQNASVKASGDIVITGRGVITSELLAGEDISVSSPMAVVRGGKLSAGGIARVNELGSNANVISVVRISEGSVLEAQLVHPAVTIESVGGKYQFDDLVRCIKAYISPNGNLEVEKLKAK